MKHPKNTQKSKERQSILLKTQKIIVILTIFFSQPSKKKEKCCIHTASSGLALPERIRQVTVAQLKQFLIIILIYRIPKSSQMGTVCMKEKHKQILSVYPKTPQQKKTMRRPYVAKPCPKIVQLEVGKEYSYCACGLSKTQPFCDGSHEGTAFKPIKFVATNKTNVLCLCKRSKNGPFCDNSHRKLANIDF